MKLRGVAQLPAWFGCVAACVLAAIPADSAPGPDPQQTASPSPNGTQIFMQQCAKCHGDHGEGVSALVTIAGPSLKAEHNPGRVMMAVELGPQHMPQFAYILSVEQIHAVSDFVAGKLAVIPTQGGNLSRGGELFQVYCASCHRAAVRGGALAYCGTNAPSLTSKSAALIAGAIRWGPGPMPAFPSSVLSDQDVASVVDYIRYAQRPTSPGGARLNWYGPVAEGFAAWVGVLALVFFTVWIERGGKG